jgi:hypothetical protein
VTNDQYGHSDMSTWRLKWYYHHWQRRAWRWDRISSRHGTALYRPGPAGGYERIGAHLTLCHDNVRWAAANLKRRGWFVG